MIIKFNGYEKSNENFWYDDYGNIYIFEDNSNWMIISGDTKFCTSLMNLETGEIRGDQVDINWVKDELEFEHGLQKKTIGVKDIVWCDIKNKGTKKEQFKKINFNVIDTKTIDNGDIFVLSDNSKWIIGVSYYCGKCYYHAINLETYTNSGGHAPITYLLNEDFLKGRGIIEVIKSKDILLTYKRRFLNK